MSEYDIKLEDLRLPTTGTESTDNLVPSAWRESSQDQIPPLKQTGSSGPHTMAIEPARPGGLKPVRPNYKPFPLQWPFDAIILLFIAGIFAFLEYEAHHLPSLYPNNLGFNPPGIPNSVAQVAATSTGPFDASTATASAQARPTQMVNSPVQVTRTWSNPTPPTIQGRAIPAPTPDPSLEPRPKSASYLVSGGWGLWTAYCGWGAPRWTVLKGYDSATE